jgi:hypothetical protein
MFGTYYGISFSGVCCVCLLHAGNNPQREALPHHAIPGRFFRILDHALTGVSTLARINSLLFSYPSFSVFRGRYQAAHNWYVFFW